MGKATLINELINSYDNVKSVIVFDGERYIVTYHDIDTGEQLPTIYKNGRYDKALEKAIAFIHCGL